MKKKYHPNITNYSMIDISYEILKKNQKPMSINQLIKQVFQIKKIDIQETNKMTQLYLDIVLSGRFVFQGNGLWSIKKDNLLLWDKEYFVNEEIDENTKINIEKEILDFDDFALKKNENEDFVEEEKEIDNITEDLDFILENDHIEDDTTNKESLNDEDNTKENEENDEEIIDEYEYFYNK